MEIAVVLWVILFVVLGSFFVIRLGLLSFSINQIFQTFQGLWKVASGFLLPQDYFSWQTIVYLGLFSFAMSWVARLVGTLDITEALIATAGWIFFALGVGWFLESNQIRPFGISLAPWVAGAIVCAYFFGLMPLGWPAALMTWPLVSVLIVAIPTFLTWELRPRLPSPAVRQHLVLLLLVALLFSTWFQFYFRIQAWFDRYPSLLADNFNNSGFVYRLANEAETQAKGVSLLTAAESQVKSSLDGTPWPYVERWLLNLDEQLQKLRAESAIALEDSPERTLWELKARPRTLPKGYALDLIADWSGPASDPHGYYFEKTCAIYPKLQPQPQPANATPETPPEPTEMAEVTCELATPKHMGNLASVSQ
ncbi:MAG: DUF5357 family protein [Cyanobacteria bacterium J06638_28]